MELTRGIERRGVAPQETGHGYVGYSGPIRPFSNDPRHANPCLGLLLDAAGGFLSVIAAASSRCVRGRGHCHAGQLRHRTLLGAAFLEICDAFEIAPNARYVP